MLNLAIDHGVNLVDTADMYAAGESEEVLGIAATMRADSVFWPQLARVRGRSAVTAAARLNHLTTGGNAITGLIAPAGSLGRDRWP
ncbi:MAG TPA: aldo/keto reductase [Trebonia sp.]